MWSPPPRNLPAEPAEVHLWRVPLEVPAAVESALAATLSAGERDRASRFHFPRDTRRFVVARAALRGILARYLDAEPSALCFAFGPAGKPSLDPPAGLRFNLSHSHELALIGVTYGREIGVDLEQIRPLDISSISGRYFSPDEAAEIRALSTGRPEAFFRCWTRKEAYLKALGDGFSLPLDTFSVTLALHEPPALRRAADPGELTRWAFHSLEPEPGYLAAVAVEGAVATKERYGGLKLWEWSAV